MTKMRERAAEIPGEVQRVIAEKAVEAVDLMLIVMYDSRVQLYVTRNIYA